MALAQKGWILVSLLLAAVTALTSAASAATTFATLYDFQGGSDGAVPYGGLIFDASGALYSAAEFGGNLTDCPDEQTPGCGVVFKLTPPMISGGAWTESALYTFTNASDGGFPGSNLIFDAAGALYGATDGGGNSAACSGGCGVVFKLTPPTAAGGAWTERVLYSFKGGTDGAFPNDLIFDASGALYGTTYGESGESDPASCSSAGCGTVFKLTPPTSSGGVWTESVLYRFSGGSDGGNPVAGLIVDASGALYGMARFGGLGGNSTCVPGGGCGTVFKLTPPAPPSGTWRFVLLHSFTGGSDGSYPFAELILDATGALYGTASGGGNSAACTGGCGLVFKLTPPTVAGGAWTESVPHSFVGGSDGSNPASNLIFDPAGALYGTTSGGGNSAACPGGCGLVFKLTPPTVAGGTWTETVLHTFTGGSDGSDPYDLIFDAAGALYGTTDEDGDLKCEPTFVPPGCGTVFKLSGAGTPLSKNPQTADFDAAGRSDILWQNTNGQAAIWLMDGAKPITTASVGANPGTSWHVIGSGDFYGSLYADILWQNTDGAVAIWEMNGLKVVANGSPGNPGPNWHAIGTGDFNGDGKSDILWQNTNGAVAIWEMDGLKVIASAVIGNPGTSWHVIGSGDFNGDGYSDILWQNTNGAVAIWQMNGFKVIGSAVVGNPGTGWHVIGSGDFYGNGYSDILWQNTNGAVDIWEMDGLKEIASAVIGNPGTSWHVVGSGDFYGDGFSDILWQNTNGEVDIWEMDGAKVIDTGSPGNPGASWLAIGECPVTRFALCVR